MAFKETEYRRGRHVVYELDAHLVFVTKYRRGVITNRVRELIVGTAKNTVIRHNTTIKAIDGEDDHIHLLISYPPKISISTLVAALKTTTAKAVRQANFVEVNTKIWGNNFWSPSYFVASTGGANLETVKKYVENQRAPKKPGNPNWNKK